MKIAVHSSKLSFSENWISYCQEKKIPYKLVDCYKSDIVQQLEDCDALMWHFNHKSPKASKFAKQLIYAIQASGKRVFPDFNTVWHFDDKVGQKYLLESIGAPLVNSYVFYSKQEAIEWANQTSYPKVFKLRNGAGSDNVHLVKSKSDAFRLINKAFGKGFSQYEAWSNLKERFRKYNLGKANLWDVFRGIIRLVYKTEYSRIAGREIGYAYFQDFIERNNFDIRIIVIEDKAFAIKRMVREGDFRASGSGFIFYEKENFDNDSIQLAFKVSEEIDAQCIAFDILYSDGKPLIIEISYGFSPEGYISCPGYWDRNLNWHEGIFNPYGWMVDNLLGSA